MKTLIFDLEANGYLYQANKIWCICWTYNDTDHVSYSVKDYSTFIKELLKAEQVVGHNILGYDLPLISKLLNVVVDTSKVIDTFVWSRLFFPTIDVPSGWRGTPKPHSLEAWAMRLGGVQKQQHEEWDRFSEEMLERCKKDVKITKKLYNKLLRHYKEKF